MLSFNTLNHSQKQSIIKEQYNKIYNHELAHKAAGGSLAGGIVIEKNSDGVPVAGHVSIKMPTLDEANPDKTIQEANTVIKSAMAPADPSDQDYKVAENARRTLSEAQQLKNTHKLNYLA